MQLNTTDYWDFINTYQSLIVYVGKKKKILSSATTLQRFRDNIDVQLMLKCANAFYENTSILDAFLADNPDKLTKDQLSIASEFRHFRKGRFFVYKYLKEHTIFIQDNIAYGVLALSDPFEHFFANRLPTTIETVLLPFKGRLVYHGLLAGGNMHFGKYYKQSLNEVYKTAKAKYGIITSLPFDGATLYDRQSPAEQLAYFMKTKANREEFEKDIQGLIKKHADLLPQYYQTWGKVHATTYKKRFKELGLNKAYYALLQGQIISSAVKQKDLNLLLDQIVPNHKRDWVHVFRM